jgi:hydrogenase/urease accessory protein HupE
MKSLSGVAAFICLLARAVPVAAHPAPFSYLDVVLLDNSLDVTLVAHTYDLAHDLKIEPMERLLDPAFVKTETARLVPLLLSRLQIEVNGRSVSCQESSPVELLAERQSLKFHLSCGAERAGVVSVTGQMFPYDLTHQTFLNIYEGDDLRTQAILYHNRTSFEYFAGTRQGVMEVVRRFVPAGIHHILIGPDHLLFLFGLLLLGGSLKQLALVVSAFTVAHSVTLSLAALNLVNPPARVIEPAIALSIVYVGADNLLVSGGRDMRAWIALAFGFIHGFGFANVLREMNLPSRALGWSLFSFNLGVEIGQLAVVIAVASTLAWLRTRNQVVGRGLVFAGSVVVMAAGTFWFVQRVFFSGGVL